MTGRLAVALIFSGNTAQLNGRVNGTAKAQEGSVACRDVGRCVWQKTWNTPTTIAGTAPISQTVVAAAPPPAAAETVVVAPGPGYVWVDGEWIRNGGWVWVTGHWIVPPYPHAVWVRGGWIRGPHGYRRVPGHWG